MIPLFVTLVIIGLFSGSVVFAVSDIKKEREKLLSKSKPKSDDIIVTEVKNNNAGFLSIAEKVLQTQYNGTLSIVSKQIDEEVVNQCAESIYNYVIETGLLKAFTQWQEISKNGNFSFMIDKSDFTKIKEFELYIKEYNSFSVKNKVLFKNKVSDSLNRKLKRFMNKVYITAEFNQTKSNYFFEISCKVDDFIEFCEDFLVKNEPEEAKNNTITTGVYR